MKTLPKVHGLAPEFPFDPATQNLLEREAGGCHRLFGQLCARELAIAKLLEYESQSGQDEQYYFMADYYRFLQTTIAQTKIRFGITEPLVTVQDLGLPPADSPTG